MNGIIDLIKDIINPRMNLRYKITRTLGRVAYMRNVLAKKFGHTNSLLVKHPGESSHIIVEKSTQDFLDTLERDGFSTGIRLRTDAIDKIVDFCNNSLFDVNRNTDKNVRINYLDTIQEEGHIFALLDPHVTNELIYEIATDSRILSLVTKYLGVNPYLYATQLWYTFPDKGKKDHYDFGYHYDIDDIKFIKLFFY